MKATTWLPAFALVAASFPAMAQEAKPQEEVPAALAGLRFVREEAVYWYVYFGSEKEGKWMPFIQIITAKKALGGNKNNPKPWLAPGAVFFKDGPMAGRFKFIGFTQKEIKSAKTGTTHWVTAAEYEDQKPNKKGSKYQSIEGLHVGDDGASPLSDSTAVFSLPPLGNGAPVEFKVEELTNFALPPDAKTKDFFLKEVTPAKVVVEYKDSSGGTRNLTIPKSK